MYVFVVRKEILQMYSHKPPMVIHRVVEIVTVSIEFLLAFFCLSSGMISVYAMLVVMCFVINTLYDHYHVG